MWKSPFSLVRMGSFAMAILTGAFLVFQVQPIVSKAILPWFGGSPAVWTTCMLFFQVVLFGGYLYAHLLTRHVSPRWQGIVHLSLLCAALFSLPVIPDGAWKPIGSEAPSLRILVLLACTVGLPYFVLSATGPLMQAWFSRANRGRSPYRLFALSNFGSLVALLSYPFIFEPLLSTRMQGTFWSVLFFVYAASCVVCVMQLFHVRSSDTRLTPSATNDGKHQAYDAGAPTWRARLEWLALPAFASVMLLAVTNHVCQNISVTPFMWVVPLSLYLLTFIICFDNERWYSRPVFAAGTLFTCVGISLSGRDWFSQHYFIEVALYFAAMFFVCMICHGELARRKPHPKYLTSFYLMCSAGGAVGGVLVAVVCPTVFSSYFELNLSVLFGYVLSLAVLTAAAKSLGMKYVFLKVGVAAVVFIGLVIVAAAQLRTQSHGIIDAKRNFYGVLKVASRNEADSPDHRRVMFHGQIVHGEQYMNPPRRREPTTYYSHKSGVGLTLARHARTSDEPIRVGAVGLGAGTVAAYGRAGDYYRFYEINPDVVSAAERQFSFLSDSRAESAEIEIVLGDARLSMEREPPQAFDVLILDAFSGDAIPTHLLTREAFDVYLRHLKPSGVIAVHISNLHLDLAPVVRGLGEHSAMKYAQVSVKGQPKKNTFSSHWILLSRNEQFLQDSVIRAAAKNEANADAPSLLWTDGYNNLFRILK